MEEINNRDDTDTPDRQQDRGGGDEMVERIPFQSLHIDARKGEFFINGEEIKLVSRINLEFDNGKWLLLVTRDELYEQAATN